jgi:hypothetical protein
MAILGDKVYLDEMHEWLLEIESFQGYGYELQRSMKRLKKGVMIGIGTVGHNSPRWSQRHHSRG